MTPLQILLIDGDSASASKLCGSLREHDVMHVGQTVSAHQRLADAQWFDVVVCRTTVSAVDAIRLRNLMSTLVWEPTLVFTNECDGQRVLELVARERAKQSHASTRVLSPIVDGDGPGR